MRKGALRVLTHLVCAGTVALACSQSMHVPAPPPTKPMNLPIESGTTTPAPLMQSSADDSPSASRALPHIEETNPLTTPPVLATIGALASVVCFAVVRSRRR